jgi:hypothetical protein
MHGNGVADNTSGNILERKHVKGSLKKGILSDLDNARVLLGRNTSCFTLSTCLLIHLGSHQPGPTVLPNAYTECL